MQENIICPYPGLRPFTEEESIFFKGRDQHIEQITGQVEEKKFVMLTGASGDGKSSIVYAGVIPNARAGFLRAKFNNWIIADFKPQRSPLENFASSLSQHMNLDYKHVYSELSHGFSSLVDLYKSSGLFVNMDDEDWNKASLKRQKELKNKSSNLFILVDQFEEFFTNAENYKTGKPSRESQIVINTILETAKIAYKENLPIYIICTMRSDYIGQCAAFRGLPEMIGFSQFFVPRLRRKELYEVITEPALLNGNDISRRLTETLINEMDVGFDQLPVLQHSLNQIWEKANQGKEKMDLIHLAKISGINKALLPPEDLKEFDRWYNALLEKQSKHAQIIQSSFENASLGNILNTHGDELCEKAHEDVKDQIKGITYEKTQYIIKVTFQCLTRIDDGRAVRNRMSLKEISSIINQEGISTIELDKILNIFRKPGNTLLNPFTSECRKLDEKSVLDITHESLIRNWSILKHWAHEEHNNYLHFLDLKKQMNRWLDNEMSRGFLLPIGPYSFFEKWFKEFKPNKYWLARYDERNISREQKLIDAEKTLDNIQKYLKKSAQKLFFSRIIMKYGPTKIAAVFGLVFLLISIAFYIHDYSIKQNNYILKKIEERGLKLLNSDDVRAASKSTFIINYELLHPGSSNSILDIMDDSMSYEVATRSYWLIEEHHLNSKKKAPKLKNNLLNYSKNKIFKICRDDYEKDRNIKSKNIGRLSNFLSFAIINATSNNKSIDSQILSNKELSLVYNILKTKIKGHTDSVQNINTFNKAIINYNILEKDLNKIRSIIKLLSPFKSFQNFSNIYPKGSYWVTNELRDIDHNHNGGYQVLGYLYAHTGNFHRLNHITDTLLKYNDDYKIFKRRMGNSHRALDLILTIQLFNQDEKKDSIKRILNKYASKTGVPYKLIIRKLTNLRFRKHIYGWYSFNLQESRYQALDLLSEKQKDSFWDLWRMHILKDSLVNKNQFHFNSALYWKKRGELQYIIFEKKEKANSMFARAFKHFNQVDNTFLSKNYLQSDSLNSSQYVSNRFVFLCPVININILSNYGSDQVLINAWFKETECSSKNGIIPFYDYQITNYNFKKLYNNVKTEELKLLKDFPWNYSFEKIADSSRIGLTPTYQGHYVDTMISLFDSRNVSYNSMYYTIYEIEKAYFNNDTNKMRHLSPKLIEALNSRKDPDNYNFKISNKLRFIGNYYLKCDYKKFKELIRKIEFNFFTERMLTYNIQQIEKNVPVELTFDLLELGAEIFPKAYKEHFYRSGKTIFPTLGEIGGEAMDEFYTFMIMSLKGSDRPRAIMEYTGGIAKSGNYYKAYLNIPKYTSLDEEMNYLSMILHVDAFRNIKSLNISFDPWFDNRLKDLYYNSSVFSKTYSSTF